MKKLILCLCFLGIASPSMAGRAGDILGSTWSSGDNKSGHEEKIKKIKKLESQIEKQKGDIEKLEEKVDKVDERLGALVKLIFGSSYR